MEAALALVEAIAALVPPFADLMHRLAGGDPTAQKRVQDVLPPRDIASEIK